jgi:hypothetical protein
MRGGSEDLHATGGHVDDEQRVVGGPASPRPDFRLEEVGAGNVASCARRKVRREVERCGTRGSPAAFRIRRMVERPTRWLTFVSASWIRVSPRRIFDRRAHHELTDLGQTPRRPDRVTYVHFGAINSRCHRSKVSGVAIVAIFHRAVRPARYARAASRRRSSSVRVSPQGRFRTKLISWAGRKEVARERDLTVVY